MQPVVKPITDEDVPAVSRFLHQNLNPRVPVELWRRSLMYDWAAVTPNHGFLMRADGKIVGVLCAIYSDQDIDGRAEKFCNPHSWCVVDAHRGKSIDLVTHVLRQKGYHFTMLTPNPEVADVFRFFRFRRMDECVWVAMNTPAVRPFSNGFFLTSDTEEIAECLSGAVLRNFHCHRQIEWLHHLVFGDSEGLAYVVYKKKRWKRLPCAQLLYVSEPHFLRKHFARVASHLLLSEGLVWTRAERRLVGFKPRIALGMKRSQPKLLLSETLRDSQIQNLFTELVALDL